MPQALAGTPHTRRTVGGPDARSGVVAGHLLKLARQQLGLSQERLAERLGQGKNTIQGWESGRRALFNVRRSDLYRLLRSLRALGAAPDVLGLFDDALEADHFLHETLTTEPERIDPASHPLSMFVIKRGFAEMLAWPLTGRAPAAVPDVSITPRGPEPDRPTLTVGERMRFFAHLRMVAERASAPLVQSAPTSVLLRRQAYYLSSWDVTAGGRNWLQDVQRREQGRRQGLLEWSPEWAAARSLVVARARQGDPDPLRHFLRIGLRSDELEAANLNYWAYWIDETRDVKHGDNFMAGGLGNWGGVALLARLHDQLLATEPTVELYVHSVWALIRCRPWVLEGDPALRLSLEARLRALQGEASLSRPARSELDSLGYVLGLRRPVVVAGPG